MLMLSRKKNESFVIEVGDELITITVTDIGTSSSKKQVQVGIDAPDKFKVWRTELYESIQENRKAVTLTEESPSNLLKGFYFKK